MVTRQTNRLVRRAGGRHRGPLLVLALGVSVVAFPASVPVTRVDASRQQSATEQNWPMHGRDAAETRYSPLDRIHAGNVGRLAVVWRYDVAKQGARLEATPLVSGGVLYASGPMSMVFALNAQTGEEMWRWDPGIPDSEHGGPRACCGNVNRGVALHDGRVYAGLLDGRLVALDARKGALLWQVQTTPPGTDYSVTGAPRIAGGNVIIGNAGAEYGVRGYVSAYNARTGAQVWRTYTVPGDPALGFESEAMRKAAATWTGEWWKAGGGGTVWDGMAWDAESNLLYVGTGNGSPWSRDHRSPGGGDNLYLSSILALDPSDGRIVWHYQTTPGDDWDYTATQPLVLLDLTIGGRSRKVIVQAPKNGFFYVIDRLTGELISAQPFADDLTWASGIDPATGRPIETARARYGSHAGGSWISPGPTGAHNWFPMAWSAITGLVYIPAQNNAYLYRKSERFAYQPGSWNTGTGGARSSAPAPERPALRGPSTVLLAWDPVANREVWRAPASGGNAGTLATGGSLVFWGVDDRLLALDARTGRELWAARVGRAPGSPITWAIEGRQYVTIAAGLGGDDPPRVWTFALPPD